MGGVHSCGPHQALAISGGCCASSTKIVVTTIIFFKLWTIQRIVVTNVLFNINMKPTTKPHDLRSSNYLWCYPSPLSF